MTKKGFTMLEVMIASTLLIIVVSQLLTAFIQCQKIMHSALSISELSLRGRALREKILFKLSANGGLINGIIPDAFVIKESDSRLEYQILTDDVMVAQPTSETEFYRSNEIAFDKTSTDGSYLKLDKTTSADSLTENWLCLGGEIKLDEKTSGGLFEYDDDLDTITLSYSLSLKNLKPNTMIVRFPRFGLESTKKALEE